MIIINVKSSLANRAVLQKLTNLGMIIQRYLKVFPLKFKYFIKILDKNYLVLGTINVEIPIFFFGTKFFTQFSSSPFELT